MLTKQPSSYAPACALNLLMSSSGVFPEGVCSRICAHFAATKESLDSQGLAQLMTDNFVRFHGIPAEVMSDRAYE